MKRLLLCALTAVAASVGMPDRLAGGGRAFAQVAETPKQIIAAHIRRQGFACVTPLSAVRNRRLSRVHAPVWLLRCENDTYQVRLVPDMAAEVSRIK